MLNIPPVVQSPNQAHAFFFFPSSSCLDSATETLSLRTYRSSLRGRVVAPRSRLRCSYKKSEDQLGMLTPTENTKSVKAVVSVKVTILGGLLSNVSLTGVLDGVMDLLGKTLLLELVSAELNRKTGTEKETVKAFAHRAGNDGDEVKYEANFPVPNGFGEIGAVFVTNEHHKEMYLNDIVLSIGDTTNITIDCRSWVHSKFDNPEKRIFFTTKSYLPSETPSGLNKWRKRELEIIRGDGTGQRKSFERIYDYDTYNDLGDPDFEGNLARPVLGGTKELPYPRRCRTGRPKTKKDPKSEERSLSTYVPRDESFSEVKATTFSAKTVRSVLHAVAPSLESAIVDTKLGFTSFSSIDALFDTGLSLPNEDEMNLLRTAISRPVEAVKDGAEEVLLFETPAMIDRDKFSWLTDEEFSRQTLAGVNPLSIQLVTEFPFVSKLDPKIYGPPESAITEELIEREIKGIKTVKEALKQKKLFILDYHDLLLPYVHKIRELGDTTLYGSRTLFFLTANGTLKPIAIELTRPASPTKSQWKRVFTHTSDSTGAWLWRFAKAHVCAHDTGYHELVSHWLRTHCCAEPYVIASNRQLSVMHPIYRLLHPHFRYTMEINALAREFLISGGGIIETCFFPGKYSMELSSIAYRDQWRFDMEALPADLIRRGMAVEDPTSETGLRLTIEDYPFANDGLLVWSSTKQWVSDYVHRYYPTPTDVEKDCELQAWWNDIRTKGHADKKDEPWWPVLNNQENLIHVLSTIIWVTSAHHAAVNFGQYHYGGYFPNRPSIIRDNMPVEDDSTEKFTRFLNKPESVLLHSFPSQIQATVVMAILDVLSNHNADEEYLGGESEPAYEGDEVIKAAFERFNGRMKEIEVTIDGRNADPKLVNRCGAGIVPYELLKPFSEPGVTGKGVPNSISI